MSKWALVLFDHDGYTGVSETTKLNSRLQPDYAFQVSDRADMSYGSKTFHVEVLALADKKASLDVEEEAWLSTHRALAVQAEKDKRENSNQTFGGFLEVWPTESLTPKKTVPTRKRKQGPSKDTETATKSPKKPETLEGTNGRKITVFHQGSGDYSTLTATAERDPVYVDHLTQDQREILQNQITNNNFTRFVQTDDVIIFNNAVDMMSQIKPQTSRQNIATQTQPSIIFSQTPINKIDAAVQTESTENTLEKKIDEMIKMQRLILNQTRPNISLEDILSSSDFLNVSTNNNQPTPEPEQTFITRYTVPVNPPEIIEPMLTPVESDAEEVEPERVHVPVLEPLPNMFITHHKRSKMSPCFEGPILEIEQPLDISAAAFTTEVRVKPDIIRTVKDSSISCKNFGWNLVKTIFKPDEIRGHNFYGNKGKVPLSPRRKHAIEHAVVDLYGPESLQMAVTGINCGIRNCNR